MTERDEVTVDDIIGLIKTYEPTNSVKEVKRLRGRFGMTEKERFTVDGDGKYWDKIENKYVTIDHLFRLVESLEKENERLKRKKERYKILAESRGERLDNYICTLNKFIKEHLEDESCNEAAKKVLREVSGTFVKEYDVSAENRKLRQENEELKHMITEAYNTERTTLGKSVLKQLIDQME